MPEKTQFLAFDLGAESGRAVAGTLQKDKIFLQEIHRFVNGPVKIQGHLFWDVLHLFQEMKEGLAKAIREGYSFRSLGVDTWGVDYALLAKDGSLLGNPYHYRDPRTNGIMEEAFRRVPREEIFRATGIQFMQLNTLYQLLSMVVTSSPLLEAADCLLMMPDLFHYWFTGQKVSEFTIATTSQCYNPLKQDWDKNLLEKMGIPTHIFPQIIPPGTPLASMLEEIAEETGAKQVQVIAPGSHDTASAVAAVPAEGDNFAYISSGTWSLMGIEVSQPIINEKSLQYNFTNEGGVAQRFRFLRNIMGLWLVQECRRTWAREGKEYSYDDLTQMAKEAKPFKAFVDPDDPRFLAPGNMPERIREFCRETHQQEPETPGEVIRCALESLALKYRWVLDRLEDLLGQPLSVIHIVGGGSQNTLLCQFTADATGKPTSAGPIEATALGNLLTQAMAQGYLASLQELRRIVRQSFEMVWYQPQDTPKWQRAYQEFQQLINLG